MVRQAEPMIGAKNDQAVLASRARNSLLAGALGDAIGGVVEFQSYHDILSDFGPAGIQRPEHSSAYGRAGAVTDDTQMTLFTGEGLIRALVRSDLKGICHPPSVIHHAYLRWLLTQGGQSTALSRDEPDGWLWSVRELHVKRAPGNTCLQALQAATSFGQEANNNSKGCGGVMRVAPIGIFAAAHGLSTSQAFELGVDSAKLTHGHPSGFLSAGAMAVIVASLMVGQDLPQAVTLARQHLLDAADAEETLAALDAALRLAEEPPESHQAAIKQLGEGWVAEEALAIGLYCALVANSLAEGVLLAANHDGDTDSTASIAGNLLGCVYPKSDLPADWLEVLELKDVIAKIADDLVASGDNEKFDAEAWWDRYPGW